MVLTHEKDILMPLTVNIYEHISWSCLKSVLVPKLMTVMMVSNTQPAIPLVKGGEKWHNGMPRSNINFLS